MADGKPISSRLAKMQIVRSVRVRIARPNGSELASSGQSLATVAEVAGEFGAQHVLLKLSMGHYKGSLEPGKIRALFRYLRRHAAGERDRVEEIWIDGRASAEDEREQFDLLKYRLVDRVDVEIGAHRIVPYLGSKGRKAALDKAWSTHAAQVSKLYAGT